MIWGITHLLNAMEIIIGVSKDYIENQNTVNLSSSVYHKLLYITGVKEWGKSHTNKKTYIANYILNIRYSYTFAYGSTVIK